MFKRISVRRLLLTMAIPYSLVAQNGPHFTPYIADIQNPVLAAMGMPAPPMRLYVAPGVLREDVPAPPTDPDAKKDFIVVLRLYQSGRGYLMQPAIHGCVVQTMPAAVASKDSESSTLSQLLPSASDWTSSATVKVKQVGRESVAGIMCRVLDVENPGQKIPHYKVWVAPRVNLPVQLEYTDTKGKDHRTVFIQHLIIGPIPATLLQPPKRCQFVPGWNNGVQITPGTME